MFVFNNCPFRLVVKDAAFSRQKHEFNPRKGHKKIYIYIMRKILNIFVLLPFIIILNNCSSLSLPSFMEYFNYSKTGADVLSYSTTEKTTSDHALSYLFGKDCSLARPLRLKAICREINKDHNYKSKYINTKQVKSFPKKNNIYPKRKIIKVPSMAYDFN